MKAAYIESQGGPEVLKYGDLPDPVAGPGEVLIDIVAASVNGADWKVRAGDYGQLKFPYVLGRDFSGTVAALGEGVSDFRVGDRGVRRVPDAGQEGAYAEKIAIKAAIVAKKPDGLSHVNAAALALTGLTAMNSVEDTLKLQRGETILIQGGAGGVASFAIQLAKHIGARVITTASTAQPRLRAQPRRRRGHRLQHDRFHQGGVQRATRCSRPSAATWRRNPSRCSSPAAARPSSRPARRRRSPIAPTSRAAAAGRPRPRAARAHRRAVPAGRRPRARGQALSPVARPPTPTA